MPVELVKLLIVRDRDRRGNLPGAGQGRVVAELGGLGDDLESDGEGGQDEHGTAGV